MVGLNGPFRFITSHRPSASENSLKFWVSRGTARTADPVSINFGDVLHAGCWDCWCRPVPKKMAIFWNGSCHRPATLNIN